MLISVTYGNENFQHSSAKFQLFGCRTREHPGIDPVQKHLWMMARDGQLGRHGGQSTTPAAPGYKESIVGKWSNAQYDAPEGLVLKLYGQRKLPEMTSGHHVTACVFLRVREAGPLVRVTGNLTGDQRASRLHVTVFEGRADQIALTEGREAGITVPAHQRAFYEGYNVNVLFAVEVLAAELESRPRQEAVAVENTEGRRVRVQTARRARAIQV